MIIHIHNRSIGIHQFAKPEMDHLIAYFNTLDTETKRRFGPHQFTRDTIIALYNQKDRYKLYFAKLQDTNDIIAYSIIKIGWLEHDMPRLRSYGLEEDPLHDCTFAPSVADEWTGKGLGKQMFKYIHNDLKVNYLIHRIFLWGGVQCSNLQALGFYKKLGFIELGHFEYNGDNLDMMLLL